MIEYYNKSAGSIFTADFFILKVGDKFKYKGKIFQKINEDKARRIKDGSLHFFWPQWSTRLLKPIPTNEFAEKYLK